ncbi:hypothetical protein K3392_24635 (plasmid) [Escherichia coli]|nr:hypothetical protein K3392_24635 [Escherichia coli]
MEYYGKFWSRNFNYRLWSAMQSRLLKWMQSKYRLSNRKAQRKLDAGKEGVSEAICSLVFTTCIK